MGRDRVQKILARAGIASRRGAEDLIRQGRVTVNGRPIQVGDKADAATDSVKVDGKRVRTPTTHLYLLLNKPKGYLTTRDDPQGRPTVFDLVPRSLRRRLFPVGRLDYDSEGLLLLTDDGELAQRLSHPRHGCAKTYAVKVKGEPDAATLGRLRHGIVLDGKRTLPARIDPLKVGGRRAASHNTWWKVVLREGRTRQIREMFHRAGHPVQRLRRTAIGPLSDARLASGSSRALETAEVERLASGVAGGRG